MNDLVEDFINGEKDGLAGLEGEIPSVFKGKNWLVFVLHE